MDYNLKNFQQINDISMPIFIILIIIIITMFLYWPHLPFRDRDFHNPQKTKLHLY